MKVQVTALKKIGPHPIGQTFAVTPKEARVLILAKLALPAEEVPEPEPRLRRTYRRRDMQAELPESPEST
jgi:hypothetical protein